MSAHPLSDLLPIPDGVLKPNAYDVFGLKPDEADPEVIQTTMRKVIRELKASKETADPKRWKAAARLATDAKQILSDPSKREQPQLTTVGGVAEGSSKSNFTATSLAEDDPLYGLLPDTNPLEDFVLVSEASEGQSKEKDDPAVVAPPVPVSPPEPVTPPELPTTPHLTNDDLDSSDSTNGETTAIEQNVLLSESLLPSDESLLPSDLLSSLEFNQSQPTDSIEISGSPDQETITLPSFEESIPAVSNEDELLVKRPQGNRRRRSKTGMLVPAIFAICCFGIVGVVLFFIINRPGVVITVSDDGFAVNTKPEDQEANPEDAQNQPQAPPPAKPKDPIMGSLGPDSKETKNNGSEQKLSDPIPETKEEQKPKPTTTPTDTNMEQGGESEEPNNEMKEEMQPAPDLTKPQTPDNETSPEPLSDEVLEKAEQVLQTASQAIQAADWNQMNLIANRMLDQEMSEEQMSRATELFQIIDLAIFYRTAITDSISKLEIGNDFEVTRDFRVIVVEKSPEQLVVRYNAKNKTYTIDELPWALAHQLARFEVAGDTFSTAAKSVYQFIAPKTNDGLRDEALEWIREIQSDLDGTDKENIESTLQSLFSEKE